MFHFYLRHKIKTLAFYVALNVNVITKTRIIVTEDTLDFIHPIEVLT